MKEKVGFRINF